MMAALVRCCVLLVCVHSAIFTADAYENVALHRPAFQRDNYNRATAEKAVDGDLNSFSCTSMCCVQPWWGVELAEPTRVLGVKVFSDKDPYWAYRLDNFTVGLSNQKPTLGQPLAPNTYTVCGQHDGRVLVRDSGFGYVQCNLGVHQKAFKYVIVASSLSTPDAVCFAEVEVCTDTRKNWARGRPTFQLDTYGVGVSSRAVDGNLGTASMTTMNNAQPWWAVELERPIVVHSVKVTNDNNDYFAYRLNNFIVGLSNSAPAPGRALAPNSYTRCAQYQGPTIPSLGTAQVKCAANLPAFKYVILQTSFTTNDAICLTEVEVYTEPYDPCQCQPCNNGGVCKVTGDTTFVCQCAPGWTSEDCSRVTNSNPCANSPCKNGGTCTQGGSTGFSCSCVPGWTGNDCTTDVNVCAKSNPCKNGGTCVKYGDSYECHCPPHWAGKDCEMGSAACKAVPVAHRVNCGWGGVTANQCNERSCCFDESIKDRPACFYSSFACDNLKASERVHCGWEGISYVQCINRGCCFDDDEETNPTGPTCFRRANPACVGVKAADRVARGLETIQPNECNAQGWCFDSSIPQSSGPWCFSRA